MARVLVLGSYGLLGSGLCPVLKSRGHFVMRQGRRADAEFQLDPTFLPDVRKCIDSERPSVVINLIAMTNVDECERNPKAAYLANVVPTKNLAEIRKTVGFHLIQVSTDQVYGGIGPHDESQPEPCNVYGLSKLYAEEVAFGMRATVLRTNFVGRSQLPGRAAFTDWLVNSFRTKEHITLFEDVLFSPLHWHDLALRISESVERRVPGVFNLGSQTGMSKAEFGMGIAQSLGCGTQNVSIGSVEDSNLIARRPKDMRLETGSFQRVFSDELPSMKQTVTRVIADYR